MKIRNYANKSTKDYRNEISFTDFLNNSVGNASVITRSNILERDATTLACVDIISSTIASMGLQLYEKVDVGKQKLDNELNSIVKFRPNKNSSGFELIKNLIKDLLIYGNAFALIQTKKGEVVSIEYLDASITQTDRVYGKDKYIITSTLYDKQIKVSSEEVIWLKDFDKFSTVKPFVEAKIACTELVSNYFTSGGNEIKGVISVAGDISPEAKNILKKAFKETIEGDGIAVLESGLSYSSIAQNSTFREQQIVELKESLDNEIYKALGVPKGLVLGTGEQSSYASLEVINQAFIRSLLKYITLIETELNYKLIFEKDRGKQYFKMNYDKFLRLNSSDRADFYKNLSNLGVLSINEIRRLEELNDIPNGDEHYRSLNYVELGIASQYQLSKAGSNTDTNDNNVNGNNPEDNPDDKEGGEGDE